LVTWSSPVEVNSWELWYYETFEPDQPRSVTVSGDPSFLFENLNPNTFYSFEVRSSCGGEDGFSSFSYAATNFTECQGASSIPYVMDLPVSPTGLIPICWEIFEDDYVGSVRSIISEKGNPVLEVNSITSITALLPDLDADIQQLSIGFIARNRSWNHNLIHLEAVVLTESDVFEVIQSFDIEYYDSQIWSEYVINLDSYSGDNGRLGLRISSLDGNSIVLQIDDLVVDYTPDCQEPFNLTIDDIDQNGLSLGWLQNETVESVDILWGYDGFDTETEGELLTLNGDATTNIFSLMEPGTAYEVHVRNICSAGSQSAWSRFKVVTPYWPMEVSLTNIAENEVVNAADNIVINLSYDFEGSDKDVFVSFNSLITGDDYVVAEKDLTIGEGAIEFKLPITLPSGNYKVVVDYQNVNNKGELADFSAESHPFVIENNATLLEIIYPSRRNFVTPSPPNSFFNDFGWNSLGVTSVKIDYSIDNGLTWKAWQTNVNSEDGYNFYSEYIVYSFWIGKSIRYRISSSSNPEIFAISPETVLLRSHPFTLVSPLVQTEVSQGLNFEVVFNSSIDDVVDYYVFEIATGTTIDYGELSIVEGENLLSVPINHLEMGASYGVEIYGSKWYFRDIPPFSVSYTTPMESNVVNANDVVIYPVPTDFSLYIEARNLPESTKAVLFDLSGRKLIESTVNGAPLNLSHLASGMYVLVVEGKSYKVVKK
jgi:hypothetical protein